MRGLQALLDLCKFRNTHPAFNGSFEVLDAVADIKEYSDELHGAEAGATSAYLSNRLGMPATVARAPEGTGWCVTRPAAWPHACTGTVVPL